MHGSLPGLAAGRFGVIMFFSACRLPSFAPEDPPSHASENQITTGGGAGGARLADPRIGSGPTWPRAEHEAAKCAAPSPKIEPFLGAATRALGINSPSVPRSKPHQKGIWGVFDRPIIYTLNHTL